MEGRDPIFRISWPEHALTLPIWLNSSLARRPDWSGRGDLCLFADGHSYNISLLEAAGHERQWRAWTIFCCCYGHLRWRYENRRMVYTSRGQTDQHVEYWTLLDHLEHAEQGWPNEQHDGQAHASCCMPTMLHQNLHRLFGWWWTFQCSLVFLALHRCFCQITRNSIEPLHSFVLLAFYVLLSCWGLQLFAKKSNW